MRKGIAWFLLLCLQLPILLGSCSISAEKKYSDSSFEFFDTVTTLTVYGADEATFLAVRDLVWEELRLCHRLFDIYHSYDGMTNLYTVNENAGGDRLTVDERITDLLSRAGAYGEQTGGKLRITMGSVLRLWHDAREADAGILPAKDALNDAALHIAPTVLETENAAVRLNDPSASLDVGAIAKGYAENRSKEILLQNGIQKAILDIGGSICCIGGEFSVGIVKPADPTEYAEILHLTNRCAVTSGDYQRTFTVDGVSYHHIIDPDTLFPATYCSSLTVICDDPCLGDALSTALFCMPPEEAISFADAHFPDVELYIIDTAGQIFTRSLPGGCL